MPDPSPTILAARPDGSFRLVLSGGEVLEAVACTGGYRVERGAGPEWWLESLPEGEAGWRLRQGSSERARTTRSREDDAGWPATLLLEDGRLFRIVARRGPAAALLGDEVSGAYVEAERRGASWILERTVAGLDLELGAEGWLLLAAEIARLDADEHERGPSGAMHG